MRGRAEEPLDNLIIAPSGNGRGIFLQKLGQCGDENLVGGAVGIAGEAGVPDPYVPPLPCGFNDVADGALHGGTGAVAQLSGNGGVQLLGEGLGFIPGVIGNGQAQAAVADMLRGDPQGIQ